MWGGKTEQGRPLKRSDGLPEQLQATAEYIMYLMLSRSKRCWKLNTRVLLFHFYCCFCGKRQKCHQFPVAPPHHNVLIYYNSQLGYSIFSALKYNTAQMLK